jgi:thiol-disulfide isomerase/thioredoxin
LLAAVFAVAAVGKLLDLKGSQRALEDFGLPGRVARLGGIALPLAELTMAIALLIVPLARWGAAGALLLSVVFAGGVARAMFRGEAPDCHCFGQFHSAPAGRTTLIRNTVLAAAAAFVVVAGAGPSLTRALGSLDGAAIALVAVSVLAALLAVAVAQLWSDRRRLMRERGAGATVPSAPGLRRGDRAPNFDLSPVRGTARTLTDLTERLRPTLLLFVSTGCPACTELLSSLSRWQESLAESVTIAAIFAGDRDEVERLCQENELRLVLVQENLETFQLYRLRATPSAVPVGFNALIVGAPAEGVPAIEALIRTAVAEPTSELALGRT